ncbi:hypothetical protein A2U01_0054931, partial [Trifolium medium]|nr:hypothetical protein [Trifolium medium]
MFSGQQRFDLIKNALMLDGTGPATEEKWMMMPDMGFLLAQKYKHVVVLLAGNKEYSTTFSLLEGEPTSKERLKCLGWVNSNHIM